MNPYYIGQSSTQLRAALSDDITALYSAVGAAGTVTSVGLTSTDLTVSGSPVTNSGAITANLVTQAGVAGSYTFAALTVNSKGIITAAASGAQSGTFTGTLTGMTGSVTATVTYVIAGNICTITTPAAFDGTSNTTAMTMTGLPAACRPATLDPIPLCLVEDNNTNVIGAAAITHASGTVTFLRAVLATGVLSATGFTGSGTKGLNKTTFSYSLL